MKNGPYELVIAPDKYPGKKYRNRYVYEHQLVWWQTTGNVVPVGYVIHHKNDNKRDNRFKNLELKSRSSHSRSHQKPAPIKKLQCFWCRKNFERMARIVRAKHKEGQSRFFCCRSHQVKQQHKDCIVGSNPTG